MLFRDEANFTLSPAQLDIFGGWKRPPELFQKQSITDTEGCVTSDADFDTRFFTTPEGPCDLVQDVTTDCSVVAGLSAAINVLTGKHCVLSSIFYPFHEGQRRPRYSSSGKYIMRLNFNGCFRKVVIDDTLPDSSNERTLFVIDRRNRQLMWPALLEKAYLKVRGGYDFPGSNSGTDLWIMTGWIPEQIFLQREDVDIREVWARFKAAYDADDVVITIGTGVISPEEEAATGLIGEHDYAVQGLCEESGMCWLLVKNPWCTGPIWQGGWQSPSSSSLARPSYNAVGQPLEDDHLNSGAIWVSLEDVAQHFESMYLNWNPDLFSNRTQRHFSWKIPSAHYASTLVNNCQFSLIVPNGGAVWVLISRHFQDAELALVKDSTNSGDTMADAARQLGFMSIKVFDSGGKRVQVSGGETYQGPYVDSPQTLARLDTTAGKAYTIVLDQYELPLKEYTFTLSTFSHAPVQIKNAADELLHTKKEVGVWKRQTAGGNAGCSTYFQNPQFRIEVPTSTPMTILLFTDKREVHIHVDLVWGHGKRATTVRNRDLVASSGEYSRGCALAKADHIDAGTYTLVCSTFEPGQQASFGLQITTNVDITLEKIPIDAAGRLRTPLQPFRLSDRVEGIRATISAEWLTRASASAKMKSPGSNGAPLLRILVMHGSGPNHVVIAESGDGEFQDPTVAIRTPEFDIEPDRVRMEGLWLVVEGMGLTSSGHAFESEIFSDNSIQTGAWEAY